MKVKVTVEQSLVFVDCIDVIQACHVGFGDIEATKEQVASVLFCLNLQHCGCLVMAFLY